MKKARGFVSPFIVATGVLIALTVAFGALFVVTLGDLQKTESDLSSLQNTKRELEENLSATENRLAEMESQLDYLEGIALSQELPEKEDLPNHGLWEIVEWAEITTNPEDLGYEFGGALNLYRWGFKKASKKYFYSWENTYVSLYFTVVEFSSTDGAKSSFSELNLYYKEEEKSGYFETEVYSVTLGDEAFGSIIVHEWEFEGEVRRSAEDIVIFRENNKIGVTVISGDNITKKQALPYAEIMENRVYV